MTICYLYKKISFPFLSSLTIMNLLTYFIYFFIFFRIGSTLHEHATYSKATKTLYQEDKQLLRSIHEKEMEAADIQNELARIDIDTLNTKAHSEQLKEKLDEALKEVKVKDMKIEQIETDIKRRNKEIETKMNNVDRLNRKYDKMLEGMDEPEPLGPLEGTIKSSMKDIENEDNDLQRMQQEWLQDQSKLIEAVNSANSIQEQNTELNARLNILRQKRQRVLQNIHMNKSESKAIDNTMKDKHKDMARLNDLIGESTKSQENISDEITIMEKEFAHELKDLETKSLEIDAKIRQVNEVKGRALNDIVEIQRDIFEWEKKIKLEKETRDALDSSEELNEIRGMEKEIHRMKHKLDQINREQEKLIREMEQAIHRKEDIAVKFSNKNKKKIGVGSDSGKTFLTKDGLKRKHVELKNHLKQIDKIMVDVR